MGLSCKVRGGLDFREKIRDAATTCSYPRPDDCMTREPVDIEALPPIDARIDQLLRRIADGDDEARGVLWELVVDELRVMARRRLSREGRRLTEIQATSLVNEVFLRLHGKDDDPCFDDRAHFFGSVRRLMDQILCDAGRRRARVKHGGDREKRPLELVQGELAMLERWMDDDPSDIWNTLQHLHELHREAAEVAWQHLVLGRSLKAIAESFPDLDVRSAWRFAKASFRRDLADRVPGVTVG